MPKKKVVDYVKDDKQFSMATDEVRIAMIQMLIPLGRLGIDVL